MSNETVTLTIDDVEVTVPKGTKVIDAAQKSGVHIPHFCYHPGLPADGNCRMCIADIRTWNPRAGKHMPARRPAVSCMTDCQDNMVVYTDNDMVQKARKSVMEFLLINHPIDCPICDKAGECMLQDHYMSHDRERSELRDEKVHKPRLVEMGDRIVYNGERCILCSRCTRFTEHVTGSFELGIVNRGDRAVVEVVEGGTLHNNYSDCLADICPVGALTKTQFRFQQRVWYLRHTPSVCPGCSRNCNTVLDHNKGQVFRSMPRHRDDINGYWMCDEGRDIHALLTTDRLSQVRVGGEVSDYDAAFALIEERFAPLKKKKGSIAAVASSWGSNEEAWSFARVIGKTLKVLDLDVKSDRDEGLPADEILHTDDHNPNRKGVADFGCNPGRKGKDLAGIVAGALAGKYKALVVWGGGLARALPEGATLEQLREKVETILFIGSWNDAVADIADVVLPISAWAESEGTFTNFEGKVSRYQRALKPPAGVETALSVFARMNTAFGGRSHPDTYDEAHKKAKVKGLPSDEGGVNNSALFRHVGGVVRA